MKKILSIHDPLLKFSSCYAAVFSIIDITNENFAWLINNFGGLYLTEDVDAPRLMQRWGDIRAVDIICHGHIIYNEYSGLRTHCIERDFIYDFIESFTAFLSKRQILRSPLKLGAVALKSCSSSFSV